MSKSFASNDNSYVEIQGRVLGSSLHVQGKGGEVNRGYGFAGDFTCPEELAAWINDQSHSAYSLTGSGRHYLPMQATVKGNSVHFQVKGSGLNRGYGAAFNVSDGSDMEDLVTFLTQPAEEPKKTYQISLA